MSDFPAKLAALFDESAQRAIQSFDARNAAGPAPYTSPIEHLLFAALWSRGGWQNLIDIFNSCDLAELVETSRASGHPALAPQVGIDGYRLDFAIVDARPCKLGDAPVIVAIECDGHDFHERTKEQARRDRRRDRYLASYAITVLRFTGSEIWADPGACADEIFEFVAQHFGAARERASMREAAE